MSNAAKYGVLSTSEGRIRVSWQTETCEGGPRLHLECRETGGPPVVAPEERGFGTSLIERICAFELDGEVKHDYAPDGVICEIGFPLQPR